MAVLAQRLGEVDARLLRHHHVENEQIEGQAAHGRAGALSVDGGRHPVAVIVEIARQEIAYAAVIVHHKNVGRVIVGAVAGMGLDGCRHDPKSLPPYRRFWDRPETRTLWRKLWADLRH